MHPARARVHPLNTPTTDQEARAPPPKARVRLACVTTEPAKAHTHARAGARGSRNCARSFARGMCPFAKGVCPFAKGARPFAKGARPFAKGARPFAKGACAFHPLPMRMRPVGRTIPKEALPPPLPARGLVPKGTRPFDPRPLPSARVVVATRSCTTATCLLHDRQSLLHDRQSLLHGRQSLLHDRHLPLARPLVAPARPPAAKPRPPPRKGAPPPDWRRVSRTEAPPPGREATASPRWGRRPDETLLAPMLVLRWLTSVATPPTRAT
jgi:hypothetical protein